MTSELEKRLAAEAAAGVVEDGMIVGLGTGSTVSSLLRALVARALDIRCVATSPRTTEEARGLGLRVERFDGPDAVDRLDIAIDGADQVSPAGWLVKGGGAAHTREKVAAAAADRFLVIVASDKLVDSLRPPIPLELLPFGLAATLRELGDVRLRDGVLSPDGGVLADYLGEVGEPAELSARLCGTAGVIEHGLFPPSIVSEVLVGRRGGVDRIQIAGSSPRRT
jgi:ribose 5-phosphate isomerase A